MSMETVSETSGPRLLPTAVEEIHSAAAEVRQLRAKGASWAAVSTATGFSRVNAIRLVHNLFELTDAATRGRAA